MKMTWLIVLVLMISMIGGCGGDSTSPTSPILPPIPPVDPGTVSVVGSVQIKVTGTGYTIVYIAWKVRLRNTTNETQKVYVAISFQDKDGFELDWTNWYDDVPPGKYTVTDSTILYKTIWAKVESVVIKELTYGQRAADAFAKYGKVGG